MKQIIKSLATLKTLKSVWDWLMSHPTFEAYMKKTSDLIAEFIGKVIYETVKGIINLLDNLWDRLKLGK